MYSSGLAELLPKINEGFIRRAGSGSYEGLGKILSSNQQTTNAKALINSIRKSYAKVLHEAPKGSMAYADLPYKTADDAVNAVRASYVKELMPKIGGELDINDYARLADKFRNKNTRAKAQEVLGDKFVPFMDLLNVMSQASTKPAGTIPSLILRSKEYGAAQLLAGGALAGGAAAGGISGVTGGLGAVAIFGVPEILARAATDPKHVNRIKAFSKTNFDTSAQMMEKFSIIANDIMGLEQLNEKVQF
jgi:hypothetical protein